MELRQLEYFCTVSSLENFTKAAHLLHVSQPSVTKAIQALEAELNILLFDRSQKHIVLTEAGKIFLLHAKKILQDVQTAQLSIEKFQTKNGGVIKFGLPPMLETYFLPFFVMKFQEKNHDILLNLHECSDSNAVKSQLEKDFLDFGVILSSIEEHSANSLKLFEDEFYLCLPSSHKLSRAESVSFNELRYEKFILQPTGTLQHLIIMQRSAEAGFVPEVLLNTSQLKTIEALITGGAAVSLLPGFVLRDLKNFKTIQINPPVKFKIFLTWSRFKELSPLGTRFLKNFNELLQSLEVKP